MKRVKKRPLVVGLVRDTPVQQQRRNPVAVRNDQVLQAQRIRRCPVCKSQSRAAEVEITIGFVQVYVCGVCADVPMKALGFWDAVKRFF